MIPVELGGQIATMSMMILGAIFCALCVIIGLLIEQRRP